MSQNLNLIDRLETFKDLFDNAHDLIHIAEINGELIYVNSAWEKLLEFSQGEVQGKTIYSYIAPQHRNEFAAYRQQIIVGAGVEKEIVVGLITKTGKTVFVEGFISARFQNGIPLYTRGIFRDITLRLQNETSLKQINRELKEREHNLQQLLMHAPDAIIVIDAESSIIYWNPKAEQIFGWSAEEVKGKNLSDVIIPPQYREAHIKGMQRYISTGEARVLNKTIEVTALNRQEIEFYISLTISTTQQKGQTAFIAFIRDIDQQKRNELELEKKRLELETSNQELEQFAHVASHDLKEPVRKVKTYASRIKDEFEPLLPEKAKLYLGKLEKATDRMYSMIDGVLQYSSLNAMERTNEKIDLDELMHHIEFDLEIAIAEKKATLQFQNLPTVEGSAILFYQLFYNLINNSLKFSKTDVPPLITITSEKINSPHSNAECIRINVQDNGIGFDQENAERIFQTFSRLNSKDKYEGTGLGLALCKKIAERYGGTIEAKGEKNKGASFIITLPILR